MSEINQEEIRKLEGKKASLLGEIEKYGIDLESIQKTLDEVKQIEVDIESLRKEISDIKLEKNDLVNTQKEISDLEEKKNIILKDIQVCQGIIDGLSPKIKEAERLGIQIDDLKKSIAISENRFQHLAEEISKIEAKLDQKNTDFSLLEKEYSDKKSKLESDLSLFKNSLEEKLVPLKTEIETKTKELEVIIESCKTKTNELSVLTDKKSTLHTEYDSLDGLFKEKKLQKETEISEISKNIQERELKVGQREGDMSLKDTTLENKRTALLQIKARLEKELGKTINIEI